MKKKIKKFVLIFCLSILAILLIVATPFLYSGISAKMAGKVIDIPETPDDFVPEIRLVLFTDTHNENERLGNAMDAAYRLFDNAENYSGIDAFATLGDISSIGNPEDYDGYIAAINEHVKGDTQFITLLGNHEMKREDCAEIFKEKFNYEPNAVYEINGFQIIAFSGERWLTEWTFSSDSIKWLKNAVNEAESKSDTKPIIALQHPHNFATVYGSTVWCSPQTGSVYKNHNRVVCFSGHSHFPMNDPRSINQTTYTNVGVGAMARFEVDKSCIPGQHPEGYDKAAQFCVVEADSSGAVRVLEYDVATDTFFNDYFIENVNDTSTYCYTYKNMKAKDTASHFEDLKVNATENENSYSIEFSDAIGDSIVHHYNVKIKEDGKVIYKTTVLNDYYDLERTVSQFDIEKAELTSGKEYQLEIVAVSAYGLKSEAATAVFTA